MKKFLCLIAALTVALSLSACKNGGGDSGKLNVIDDNNRNWYEIFVRSFCDSGDDGIGDLKGVTQKLDYIADMGFNGIWLMPVCQSNTYHGYDVVDYCEIENDYGTNEDFKELVKEAHSRGINVIVDTVFNHTSSSHEWFVKAKAAVLNGETSGENARYVDYYNFSKDQGSGYRDLGGGKGWYYEARFDSMMPDLNLDSRAVRNELKSVIRFWLEDMGCDGFRLDACTSYYTGDVEKNVEFLSFINSAAKEIKPDAYIVGEVWEGTDAQIRAYYESGIDSCFLFTMSAGAASSSTVVQLFSSLLSSPGEKLGDLLLDYQKVYDKGTMAPFLCNHDTSRAANMLAGSTRIKMGAGIMSLMNGNVFVYYGDEIGMTCKDIDYDPTKRIPMRWANKDMADGQVFIPPSPGVNISKAVYPNGSVESQKDDPSSILNYYKAAMHMRNRHPEIARGKVEKLSCPDPYVAAIKKTYNGKSVTILVNLSDTESCSVDVSPYGGNISDVLDATSYTTSGKGKSLLMQPYSIVVIA